MSKFTPELEEKIRQKIEQCSEWGYEKELMEEIDRLRAYIKKTNKALKFASDFGYCMANRDNNKASLGSMSEEAFLLLRMFGEQILEIREDGLFEEK